jgi:charged multivesicular body protein 4
MNFKRLFGRKSKKSAPEDTTQQALQKLFETEEILFKKQDFLEKKVDAELEAAKKHGTTNKRLALQALRRKKQYEKQLRQLDGSLNTIQHQKHTLENAAVNAEVLQTLGSTSRTIKSAYSGLDVEDVS